MLSKQHKRDGILCLIDIDESAKNKIDLFFVFKDSDAIRYNLHRFTFFA